MPGLYYVKLFVANILFYTGILKILSVIKLKNRVIVLMYHRVLPEELFDQSCSHPGIIVSLQSFQKHLKFLKKHFTLLSADTFVSVIGNKIPFPSRSCLITFDDGWYDNYQYAYPVLKREKISAIIFLSTGFINSDKIFWQERLVFLLSKIYSQSKGNPDLKKSYRKILQIWGLDGIFNKEVYNIKTILFRYVDNFKKKKIDISKLLNELEFLVTDVPELHPVDRFMTWQDVGEMKRNGISFGSHGVNHYRFTEIDTESINSELQISKKMLHEKLGDDPYSFSYPNGDFNKEALELVSCNNYKVAFGTTQGRIKSDDPPFSLKRINVHDDLTRHIPLFYCRLLGIF